MRVDDEEGKGMSRRRLYRAEVKIDMLATRAICIGDRPRSPRREGDLSAVLRVQVVQRLASLLLVL